MSKDQILTPKEQHRKTIWKTVKITAIITVTLILAAAVIFIIGFNRDRSAEQLQNSIAAASSGTELNAAVMSVFFTDNCTSLMPYLNIDASKSLKSQYASDGRTVFELFMNITKSDVEELMSVCEAANAEGISLTDAETAALKKRAAGTVPSTYPKGVGTDDIHSALLLRALAAKYEAEKRAALTPDDSEISAYLEKNKNSFRYFDMLAFSVYYSDQSGTDTDTGAVFTEAQAKSHANELARAVDEDSFRAAVRSIILSGSPDITEAQTEEYLSALDCSRMEYTAGDEVSEWAFSASVGDTRIAVDTQACTYTVYLLTKAPYLDEAHTADFRIILLSDSEYGSHESASVTADAVIDAFSQSEASADTFRALAMEYSCDSMSNLNGGVYRNVESGIMLKALNEWIFAPERKAGDTAKLDIGNGYAAVYYDGIGIPAWRASVLDSMLDERYKAHCDELIETYPILFDENVLDMIPG